jgi:acyl-CoA dehydrogenase
MNFEFSDELLQLRDQARRFLADRCPPAVPRRILDTQEPYAADLWRAMAEMGWPGAAVPEEYGGVGLGRLAVCVLAEEIGRAVAPVPFSSSVYLATEAIMLFGSEQQKRTWLPKLASGESIGTFALAERPGPADPLKLTAAITGGRLTGTKLAVPDGDIADFAIVVANGGAWLHLVDLQASGVTRETVVTFDPTRSHARIDFAAAPADPLPGSSSPETVRTLLDYAAVPMAFEQVGGAQAALDMANAYAKERFAFGRPIGSFQGIKHKLAGIYRSSLPVPTPITAHGRSTPARRNSPSPPRSRASPPARPAGSLQKKTSRPMAAWASPGRWIVTCITAEQNY